MDLRTIVLAGIALSALIFQIANLDASSLWHDEAFSGLLPQYPFGEMMNRIALDVHPPLYYILLRVWTDIVGNSLFTLRLFSLIFGIATAWAAYLLFKELLPKKRHALLSAGLLFVSSFQIQYNMEARMYTLGSFLVVLATFFLLRALKAGPRKLWWWLGYAILSAAALYTHYYTLFVFAAHALFVAWILVKESKASLASLAKNPTLWHAAFSGALSLLLFLPWVPTFLAQLRQVQESYWIPPMNIWSVPSTVFKMLSGVGANPQEYGIYLICVFTVALALLAAFILLYKRKEAWLFAALFVTPFIASALISMKTSIYLDRYFIFFLPFLAVIVMGAVMRLRPAILQPFAVMAICLSAFGSFLWFWNTLDVPGKPGMAQAAEYINSRAKTGDSIYAGSSFVLFTFRYYNGTSIRPLLYAPNELPHFSGTALLNGKDTIQTFPNAFANTAWKIDTTGFGNFQPETPSSWLLVSERVFPDIHAYRGDIIVREYSSR